MLPKQVTRRGAANVQGDKKSALRCLLKRDYINVQKIKFKGFNNFAYSRKK